MAKIPPSTGWKSGRRDSGKEAALFVPTGTMGNTIAIKLHTEHGQEVICDSRATSSELRTRDDGLVRGLRCATDRRQTTASLPGTQIEREIRMPRPALGADRADRHREHAQYGGRHRLPAGRVDDICDRAHDLGLPVHMDGARIFNAAAALGMPVDASSAPKADTVMFCLSKALGAPVGSMLAGPRKLIDKGGSIASVWAAACGRPACSRPPV